MDHKSWLLTLLFLTAMVPALCQNPISSFDTTGRRDINYLETRINEILIETNTPAAGIALVDRTGPIWVAGLGKARLAENIDADQHTLFRIASVSKMFVALAILKLQEEGRLSLLDKVRDLVPEVKFNNPWEDTHPVRILHLLAHTTGWDELHLVEIAHNNSIPIKLRDALDFHPHSRKSRWIPGSRYAYSNSGYAVAAYIVEKITKKHYEEYIKEEFLKPLKMSGTTFFNDPLFQKHGAVTYNKDLKPTMYRNPLYRATAGMNSSASEMANMLGFFLNRGLKDDGKIISGESIAAMEVPQGNPGARAGLQLGYGLGTMTSIHNGFVYHGHNGMIDGGLTEFAYLPDQGIAHVFFINASNSDAFSRISTLIRDFETGGLKRAPNTEKQTAYKAKIRIEEGFYASINPRMQEGLFMDYLIGYETLQVSQNQVRKSWIFPSYQETFVQVTDSTFITAGTGKIGLVQAYDPLAGVVLYTDKLILKRVPPFVVIGLLSTATIWLMLTALGIFIWLMLFINSVMTIFDKTFVLCSYAMLTGLMYAALVILTKAGYADPDRLLATPGILSVSLMIISISILINTLWSLILVYRSRNQNVNRFIFWYIAILACFHLLAAVYLTWFGFFPRMTWA